MITANLNDHDQETHERYCLGLACQSVIGYSVKDSADCTHYPKECNFCRGCAETSFTPKWDASGRKRKRCRLWNLSRILNEQLQNPLVQNNSRLRLWCLIAKGYTDIEIDYRTTEPQNSTGSKSRPSQKVWAKADGSRGHPANCA